MDSATYITSRVDDQINWMEGKSKWNQTRYKRIKVMEIVAAAFIPLLAGFQSDNKDTRSMLGITLGLIGVFIVILTSLRQLNKYQENWLTYRTTLEALKAQKFLFEVGAPPYDKEPAFQNFVVNIESLLSKENESWKAAWSKKDGEIINPLTVPKNPELNNAGDASKITKVVETAVVENTTEATEETVAETTTAI